MNKYVVVDLEMCRVPKNKDEIEHKIRNEIIEIGAVLLDECFKITDSFKTFVSPQYGIIDSYIQRLTGITAKKTEGAPDFEEALKIFLQWLPDNVKFVAWSENDERQLREEIEYKSIEAPKLLAILDTCEDCQRAFAEKINSSKNYNLSEALIISGIDFDENVHDALVDAQNTALLLEKIKTEEEFKFPDYFTPADNSDDGLLHSYTYAN